MISVMPSHRCNDITLCASLSNSSGSPVTVTVVAARDFENSCTRRDRAAVRFGASDRLAEAWIHGLPSMSHVINSLGGGSHPCRPHTVHCIADTHCMFPTSTMQQASEKMSAFSLYGCCSVTSGAMLRKDPVCPARHRPITSRLLRWAISCSRMQRQRVARNPDSAVLRAAFLMIT